MGSEFRVSLIGPGERLMEEKEKQPAWAEGLNERQVTDLLRAMEKRNYSGKG